MYFQIFSIGNLIFYLILIICLFLLIQKIIYHIVGMFPSKRIFEAKQNYKYAILIPARNESAVIDELLTSIKNQTYDSNLIDTYVIVESEQDETCKKIKTYDNIFLFVRKHLELKGKGYALNEIIQDIFKSNKKYDAFFIFDADNVLAPNFIEEMNKSYNQGYQIGLGYRNSKNWNDGWVASTSGLCFTAINTFFNKCRSKFNINILVSGTGFYVASEILEKLGGWKFFTLTEDYEFTLYSSLKNIKSTYNEYAEFYDEQPTKLKVSYNQRLRWCKGSIQANKKYKKQLIKSILVDKSNKISKFDYSLGLIPMIILISSLITYSVFLIGLGIASALTKDPISFRIWLTLIKVCIIVYLFFVLYTAIMIFLERKHIKLKPKNLLVCCLMSPFYWFMYVPIYITALFKKEVEWKPIVHNVKMSNLK